MNTAPAVDVQELFRAHYLGLVRLAMRLVDDQDSAEDLVQDVFVGLARRSRLPDEPLFYLRRAVVNRANSVLRRRRVARAFLVGAHGEQLDEPADAAALRDDGRRRLLDTIAALPRRQREVVVLRFYEDLAVGEIARVLAVSPGAVSSALNRALEALAATPGVRHEREGHHAE